MPPISFTPSVVLSRWIPPDLLEQEEVWGADLFCGPAVHILLGKGDRVSLKDLCGKCFEGWRVSTNPEASDYDERIGRTPIYRQVNLEEMRFKLDPEHWESPSVEVEDEEWCVQPGDVVLNKLVPIRAALVTDRTYRHPVDANCLLIRGLDRIESAWVAFCLNQVPYEAYLTQHQGLAVLPRASLRELRQLRLPPPPEAMRRLSEAFWGLNDAYLETEERIVRTMGEVEEYIQEDLQQLESPEEKLIPGDLGTGRFLPAEAIEDSLLPTHVENAYRRRQLRKIPEWQPIAKLSIMDGNNRERLNQNLGEIPYLRLSDVDQDLMVKHVEPMPVTQATRIYKHPLGKGEVLLSTFAGSPRVAFTDKGFEDKVYVSDHWARLRFTETPAAWALVLNAKPVKDQFEGLAMGSAQQFIYADRLQRLLVPKVEKDLRHRWEEVVLTHHQRKRELDHKWQAVWEETQQVFNEVHELPNRQKPRSWALSSRGGDL
jgi:hypothetical protein